MQDSVLALDIIQLLVSVLVTMVALVPALDLIVVSELALAQFSQETSVAVTVLILALVSLASIVFSAALSLMLKIVALDLMALLVLENPLIVHLVLVKDLIVHLVVLLVSIVLLVLVNVTTVHLVLARDLIVHLVLVKEIIRLLVLAKDSIVRLVPHLDSIVRLVLAKEIIQHLVRDVQVDSVTDIFIALVTLMQALSAQQDSVHQDFMLQAILILYNCKRRERSLMHI
jgi:hypothetical protein